MYFDNLKTVAEVKSLYRTLAMQYHPDRGGDLETMKQINIEYHDKLKFLDGQVSFGTDGKEHRYHYNYDIEQEILDKINELLNLKMKDVDIELIGTWVWISGNTKPYKEDLKKLECLWHSLRKKWYFRRRTYRRKYSNLDFDYLRLMYGSRTFEKEDEPDRLSLVA